MGIDSGIVCQDPQEVSPSSIAPPCAAPHHCVGETVRYPQFLNPPNTGGSRDTHGTRHTGSQDEPTRVGGQRTKTVALFVLRNFDHTRVYSERAVTVP